MSAKHPAAAAAFLVPFYFQLQVADATKVSSVAGTFLASWPNFSMHRDTEMTNEAGAKAKEATRRKTSHR